MPRHAVAPIDETELKMRQLAPAEEMERRHQVIARLRSRMEQPVSEAEGQLWRELTAELEKER